MPLRLPFSTACSAIKPFAFSERSSQPTTETGNPALLALDPAAFAERLSGGRWAPARHHLYLSNWLADAEAGTRPRIVIEEPPRHGKSQQTSHWFPVWLLNRHPDWQIILCSYEADFAAQWGRRVRDTIEQHADELSVHISQKSHAADRWETTAGGGMQTAGVGGPITGKGCKLLIVDDPVKNAEQAYSPTYRQKAWEWFVSTAMTRLEPGGIAILIQTRWHSDDLAGRILEQSREGIEHWDELRLPALAGVGDPLGRVEGEPLWPERYDLAALEQIKARDESTFWALYQQTPVATSGSIFLREWWADGRNRYLVRQPKREQLVAARWLLIDSALKDTKSSDYTACTLFELLADYRLAVRPLWNEKLLYPNLIERIQSTAVHWNFDGKLHGIVIEDKGSGTSAIQTLQASAPQWLAERVAAFMPTGDKLYRGRQASVWCSQNRVLLPHPDEDVPALADLEEQLYNVPTVPHDDLFDTFSMGIIYLEHYLAAGWNAAQAGMVAA